MRFLLDTDWVVSFLNGKPSAVDIVGGLLHDGVAVSPVTYGEACEGLLGEPDQQTRMSALDQFTSLVSVLNIGLSVARRFARVRQDLRTQGLLIPDNDLWIAATAIEHRLTLVTRDQHFNRISGISLHQ